MYKLFTQRRDFMAGGWGQFTVGQEKKTPKPFFLGGLEGVDLLNWKLNTAVSVKYESKVPLLLQLVKFV